MSGRLKTAAKAARQVEALRLDETEKNFMGGDSYKLDPLSTLRIIASSSIFGEPSYYRGNKDPVLGFDSLPQFVKETGDPLMAKMVASSNKSTTQVFTEAIDAALDYDFGATLNLAVELRDAYYMRLNPQVIMVRAAIHPKRAEFTAANPGKFNEIEKHVMSRADEPMTQLAYFIALNKGKKNLPTILKKSIANKLSSLSAYEVNKYKNAEIGMINAVRITHANSEILNELMKSGTVVVDSSKKTWEQLRSEGKSWLDILSTTKLGHMALLRNLRGIFTEVSDGDVLKSLIKELKDGVKGGKQFPFRYWSAYKAIKEAVSEEPRFHFGPQLLDALEECIDIAIENMPHLNGKTICLSDNSGSAWSACTTEYGRVKIAEIDNLSAVITAMASDEGYVGKFGDKLKMISVTKRNGALAQATAITANGDRDVGGATEGGIWEFFRDAIKNKVKYDNIIIYSDQQAGTGGLYGTSQHTDEYRSAGFDCPFNGHINVYALVREYRKKVNRKVNVMSVQTAGYSNMVLPAMSYRTALCSGWTGKEAAFFDAYIKEWDNIDNKQ